LSYTRSRKQFDVAWKNKPGAQQYIYKLDGDTLTICHAQPDQPRPTEFKGGKGQHCWVFTRVKPDKKQLVVRLGLAPPPTSPSAVPCRHTRGMSFRVLIAGGRH